MNRNKKSHLFLLLILLLTCLVYANTINAPFQFDDMSNIVTSPVIKDLSHFITLPEGSRGSLLTLLRTRYIGYLTFALNYRLHGLDVRGYHLFNILIHLVNILLVYRLVRLTFKTPYFAEYADKEDTVGSPQTNIALFSALFFAIHPIQTQAVTYIVQRFASLATLFYLLTLLTYIRFRLSQDLTAAHGQSRKLSLRSSALYGTSLLSAVLAMKTKEFALTLPLLLCLYEFLFLTGKTKTRTLLLIPFLLTMLIIPLSLGSTKGAVPDRGGILETAADLSDARGAISRSDYLCTELRVTVTYLRLLVFPVNQNLDYDYPVYHSFFIFPVFISALLLLSLFAAGVLLLRFSRSEWTEKRHHFRLMAFGIFWFFITASAESGVIPIADVIFEHRMYLPSIGIFLAATSALDLAGRRSGDETARMSPALVSLMLLAALVLSLGAYRRNMIWSDSVRLWEDTVAKSPAKARPRYNLGEAYWMANRADQAEEQFGVALKLEPDSAKANYNMATFYMKKGLTDKALQFYQQGIQLLPQFSQAHYNMGELYLKLGKFDEAVQLYRDFLGHRPADPDVHDKLGIAYLLKGLTDKAVEQFQAALRLDPRHPEASFYLARAYQTKGLLNKAAEYYEHVLAIQPDFADAYNNLGIISEDRGFADKAAAYYRKAIELRPDLAEAHFNLGQLYYDQGRASPARAELEKGLGIDPGNAQARRLLEQIDRQ